MSNCTIAFYLELAAVVTSYPHIKEPTLTYVALIVQRSDSESTPTCKMFLKLMNMYINETVYTLQFAYNLAITGNKTPPTNALQLTI